MDASLHTLDATVVRISGEAGRTEFADGLVVLDNAGRVARAAEALARVAALELDTSLALGTALVLETDADTRVAVLGADAVGLVVEHLALGALLAEPGLAAGVDTGAGVAGLVGRALIVRPAVGLAGRASQLPGRRHHQAVPALALRLVTGHHAVLVTLAARVRAGINTFPRLLVAGGGGAAVAVPLAADHDRSGGLTGGSGAVLGLGALGVGAAADVGPPDVALRTLAARLVQHRPADGAHPARRPQAARVHTPPFQAGRTGRTVEIRNTFSL